MLTSLVWMILQSGPEGTGPVLLDFKLHQFVPLVKRFSRFFSFFSRFFGMRSGNVRINGQKKRAEQVSSRTVVMLG